jgi:sulfur carrier protein ThiS
MTDNLPATVSLSAKSEAIPQDLRAIIAPSPFQAAREIYRLRPGQTILELLRELEPNPWRRRQAIISVNGEIIQPEMWASTIPRPGALIIIRIWPSNRGIGAIFVAIAAMAAAVFTQQYWGIPLLGMTAGASAGLMGGLVGMATGIVGTLALNALIPPAPSSRAMPNLPAMTPAANLTTSQDSPTQFVDGARNQLLKWGVIPCLLGYMRIVPFKLASDVTESEGNKQFVRCLFGQHGPLEFSDLKVGQTAWDNLIGIEMDFHNGTLVLNGQTIAIDCVAKTLTRAAGSWLAYGIKTGDTLTLGGCPTPANDGDYVINAVTALTLTYGTGPATTTEAGNGAQTVSVTHGDTPLTIYTANIHEEPL